MSHICLMETLSCERNLSKRNMWKLLSKDPPYLILFVEEHKEFYNIGVTNFHQYWSNLISRSNFLYELKQNNDGLEFDDDNELVERGLDMIKNPESLKLVRISQEDKGKLLDVIMTKTFEITLKLKLGLFEGAPQSLFEMVVQPMLQTICDLQSSQNELRELLLKKDREIEEYKIEGKAPRRLITTVYNDADHMMKHTTYEDYFSAPNVPELLKNVACSSNGNHKRKTPLLPSASTSNTSNSSNTSTAISNNIKPTAISQSNTVIPKIEPSSQTSNGPSSSDKNITCSPSSKNCTSSINENGTSSSSNENGASSSSNENGTSSLSNENGASLSSNENGTSSSSSKNFASSEIIPKEEKVSQTNGIDKLLTLNAEEMKLEIPAKVEVKCERESPLNKKQRKRLNY